jgi:pimeloyl-ACP methyl ester carboxylesterase
VVDLMSLLNIEKADLIGHSFGGEVSLYIAYYFPKGSTALFSLTLPFTGIEIFSPVSLREAR